MARQTYPVRIEGRLDPELSRWLWLVKWLLAIPHYIVLAFLWIAFIVLTVVAFFAILFTARYPRGIFEFNLGVLRWTWRVAFYSYAALGTDRYPPFTLGAAPDYPATLDVSYPDELSRGLVLVKWWLLAIPHYVVVGIFVGGSGAAAASHADDWAWGAGLGLIGVLVLFAGVVLLFTTRYPRGIFDFALGLDRWVARVVAYAGLMTDRYPPLRLDQGEQESAGAADSPLLPALAGERWEQRRIGSSSRFLFALIEAQRRVPVRHEPCVRHHPRHPAVEPEREVEDSARIPGGEEQHHTREQDEHADEPETGAPRPVVGMRGRGGPTPTDEDSDDDIVRDGEQPPLHEHEAARQLVGV